MHKHSPVFYVFAGNNGSGKSTIRNLIIDKIGIDINIDPDNPMASLFFDYSHMKNIFIKVYRKISPYSDIIRVMRIKLLK
ncbi:UNVERIFIED_ORG: putative ABC-type ATPase [Heyndrickxia coagulans]